MDYNIRKQLSIDERNLLGKFSDITAHLLFHRGILNEVEAQKFTDPDYESGILDSYLLKDSEKAAKRIVKAIKLNEKIAIYSDYDADGIPGAAIFNDFFKRIGFNNFIVYIPHRHNEGFGLNIEAIEELADSHVNLLITIDCGITDVSQVEYANMRKIDVIITDHHEPPNILPNAYAIVDHKQLDCKYPEKNLCGSGVAFKLIQSILKIDRLGLKEGMEKWLLDLVAIATLSDMVPLIGENRVLAYYGLKVLRSTQRKGIVRLLEKLKINQKNINEDDIAFMITPRINAASRMGVPMDAFKLLSADDDDSARISADHLDSINNERKGAVAALVKEVKRKVNERYAELMPSVIVLGNPDWKPSLLGLAANSCAEEFDRPVFLWGRDGDNVIKGSCRSEGRSNVVEIMRAASKQAFSQFGGHKHSGGFAVHNQEIYYLEQRLNEAQNKLLLTISSSDHKDNPLNEKIIDLELSLEEVNQDLYRNINILAPFGVGNTKPIFLFRKIIPKIIRKFGKSNDHLELIFYNSNKEKISAISFFASGNKWSEYIKENQSLDLIASIDFSVFRGKPELRLRVVDVIYS